MVVKLNQVQKDTKNRVLFQSKRKEAKRNPKKDIQLLIDILVFTRPHDLSRPNSLNVVDSNKNPHTNNADRHSRRDALDPIAGHGLSQCDSSKSKSCIWEDHSPPVQVEGLRRSPDDGDESDAEEPKTQSPEEGTGCYGEKFENVAIWDDGSGWVLRRSGSEMEVVW